MAMIEPAQIEQMNIDERLRALEMLWDSLGREADRVESPKWHGEVLADRRKRAESGEARFLTLEQRRADLRNAVPIHSATGARNFFPGTA